MLFHDGSHLNDRLTEKTMESTGKARRRRFTNAEKLQYVRKVKKRVAEGMSIRKASQELFIEPQQYRHWCKAAATLANQCPLAQTICQGHPSILDEHEG